MAEKVFISHKNEDSSAATEVSDRIKRNGISTYLDVIDSALTKDGPELADYIRLRMTECDQLIAVVSNSTKESWWVPWEIGVATEKDFRIASFSKEYVSLPSYLEKWPALKSAEDIDLYCQYSKTSRQSALQKLNEATTLERGRVLKTVIGDFHRDLMKQLKARRRGY